MSNAANDMMNETPTGAPWAKFPELMSVVTGTIVSIDRRQRNDHDTKKPLTFDDGTPDMEMVIVLQTDERSTEYDDDKGLRALHAPIRKREGCLLQALIAAVKNAGASAPAIGGTYTVQHTGMDGNAKCYVAKYVAPSLQQIADGPTPADVAPAPAQPSII